MSNEALNGNFAKPLLPAVVGSQTKYRTIVADPPWEQKNMNKWKRRENTNSSLPYSTMSINEIKALPVQDLTEEDCMCYIWTTNQFLPQTFEVLKDWGFKYLSTITWVKPSGVGAWFVNRTQHIVVGYKGKLKMNKRFKPTVIFANPLRHSEKPKVFHELFEEVSYSPRLEMFARRKRVGWDIWGNELENDVELETSANNGR